MKRALLTILGPSIALMLFLLGCPGSVMGQSGNPPPPAVKFAYSNYSVRAGTAATITVSLSHCTNSTVTVKYSSGEGTAQSPQDYTAVNGTLTFTCGETSKHFQVCTVRPSLLGLTRPFN